MDEHETRKLHTVRVESERKQKQRWTNKSSPMWKPVENFRTDKINRNKRKKRRTKTKIKYIESPGDTGRCSQMVCRWNRKSRKKSAFCSLNDEPWARRAHLGQRTTTNREKKQQHYKMVKLFRLDTNVHWEYWRQHTHTHSIHYAKSKQLDSHFLIRDKNTDTCNVWNSLSVESRSKRDHIYIRCIPSITTTAVAAAVAAATSSNSIKNMLKLHILEYQLVQNHKIHSLWFSFMVTHECIRWQTIIKCLNVCAHTTARGTPPAIKTLKHSFYCIFDVIL